MSCQRLEPSSPDANQPSTSSGIKRMSNQERAPAKRSKKYVCTVDGCGMSFNLKGDLTRHNKNHLNINLFRCTWDEGGKCGYVSTRCRDVVCHIRAKHFHLPVTKKEQRLLNIADDRNASMFIEGGSGQLRLRKQSMKLINEHYLLYRNAFDLFDKDGDDCVTVAELGLVLGELNLEPSKKDLIKKFDLNSSGKIGFIEFVTKMLRHMWIDKEENKGKVTVEELNKFIGLQERRFIQPTIGGDLSEAQIDALMAEEDLDGDQQVNLEELV